MIISSRHQKILELLKKNPDISVAKLAKELYVSEPTIRRDLHELDEKGIVTKKYGGAILNQGAPDLEIPFLLRENERSEAKIDIAHKALRYIRDGMVLMLDGSTSAFHLVPYLTKFKDLIVVTSGAKTAVALAERNIRTFCTGGQMIIHSYSYVGEQAEDFVKNINADVLFFSCHGLSEDGKMTDVSVEEANLRKVMFQHSKTKILLCDHSKFGKTYFYNMGTIDECDAIVSDQPPTDAVFSNYLHMLER